MTINSNSKRSLTEGYELIGKYKVSKVISQGELGYVYKGKSFVTGKKIIIKELFPQKVIVIGDKPIVFVRNDRDCIEILDFSFEDIEVSEELNSIFANEAAVLKELGEFKFAPNFIDYFKENNTSYIVYEYIEGTTLEEFIESGKLSLEDLIKILQSLLTSIYDMHQVDIIHGDIKPDNILVDDNLNIYLCDFGNSSTSDHAMDSVRIKKFDRHFKTSNKEQVFPSRYGEDIFWIGKVITYGLKEIGEKNTSIKSENPNYVKLRSMAREINEVSLKDSDASIKYLLDIFNKEFEIILSKKASTNHNLFSYRTIIIAVVLLSLIASYGYYDKKGNETAKNNFEFNKDSLIKADIDFEGLHDEEGKAVFINDNGSIIDINSKNHSISWSNPHKKPYYSFSITDIDSWVIKTKAIETWSNSIDIESLGLPDGNYRMYLYATFEDGSFPGYIKYLDFKIVGHEMVSGEKPLIDIGYRFASKGEVLRYEWKDCADKYQVRILDYDTMKIVSESFVNEPILDINIDSLNVGQYQLQIKAIGDMGSSEYETTDLRVVASESDKGSIFEEKLNVGFHPGEPVILKLKQSTSDSNIVIRMYSINEGTNRDISISNNISEIDLSEYLNKSGAYIVYLLSDNNKKKIVFNYILVHIYQ